MDSVEDRLKFYNSLTGLVKSLENHYTVVDLRNENTVLGKIAFVDGNMNIDMENVIFLDSRGKKHEFENFYISCRNIRYVHIPEGLSSKSLLEKQCGITDKKDQKPKKKPHTFKISRAQKTHRETVLSAFESKNEEISQSVETT